MKEEGESFLICIISIWQNALDQDNLVCILATINTIFHDYYQESEALVFCD